MARNNATVGIDVEARTKGAKRNFDSLTESIDKSKRSTHELDKRIAAFGKAMGKAERANQRAARSIDRHTSTLDRMHGTMSAAAGRARMLSAAIGGAGLVAAGAAAIQKMGELASESVEVQGAFDKLQIGITKAKMATGGLVGDMDLATRANQAASLGVAKTADEFAELSRAAQILGQKLGTGTLPALDSLIGAVGRGSTLLLDNLGIAITEVTRRERAMAKEVGKTVGQLTAQERQGNRQKAMLAAISDAVDGAALEHDGLAQSITRVGVAFDDLRTKALGGGGGRSVFDALKDLQAEQIIQLKKLTQEAKFHGAARLEIAKILDDHGARLGTLRGLSVDLARAESELAGGSAELAAERNKAAREAAEFHKFELEAAKDSLDNMTREIAIAEARGAKEEEILGLKMLQTEQQAALLELEGKTKEATDKRFEAELAEIRFRNFKPKKRRRGGRKQRRLIDDLLNPDRMRKEAAKADPEFADDGFALLEEMEAGMIDLEAAAKERIDRMFHEHIAAARERDKEREAAEEDSRVSRGLRAIQGGRSANAEGDLSVKDRVARAKQLVDQEEALLVSHLEFLEEHTNDSAELERIRSEKEQVHHEMRLKRIEAEKKARQDSFRSMMSAIQVASNAQQLAANIGTLAIEAGIRGEKRKARAANIAAGSVAVVQAALEQAKAIAAFATLNIPQGLAHQAAAVAFGTAATMAFREAGGGGKGGRVGGGISADHDFGGGSTGGRDPSTVGPSGEPPSAPMSMPSGPTTGDLNLSHAAGPSGGGRPGGGNVVHLHLDGPIFGQPTDDQYLDMARGLERATKRAGGT